MMHTKRVNNHAELKGGRRPRGSTSDPPNALLQNLGEHQGLLRGLLDIAREKMTAIRGADADALQRCAQRESRLLERVVRLERRREEILARLAQWMPVPKRKTGSLREVVNELPEPISSSIRARMCALREIASQLQRENRVAAIVARDLHRHIRGVFTALAKANREAVGYGPEGQEELTASRSWLDAVG